jgi:hypothetical protein
MSNILWMIIYVGWKVDTRLWTSWAEQSQTSHARLGFHAMTKSKALAEKEVTPLTGNHHKLSITILRVN